MTQENTNETIPEKPFREAGKWSRPIKDLQLKIAGGPLEPLIETIMRELDRAGLRCIRPRFYLSTEWGVPFNTRAIAIPFYLASHELTSLHAERHGHVEGSSPGDILRYLRHEMGHVVNYAYRLYDREDWVRTFGSITQPYIEEYRPKPFSRSHVQHLPGWYAQKHPDEDWAETFAVWMTPRFDWKSEYARWPEALAKLEYCDGILNELKDSEPLVTDEELDEDVGEIVYTIDDYYGPSEDLAPEPAEFPLGLDGAIRAIFEDRESAGSEHVKPASKLIRRIERELMHNVFLWTGHFPERTKRLLRYLAHRADEMKQCYAEADESRFMVALTTFVTALAMNHVHRGSYVPEAELKR